MNILKYELQETSAVLLVQNIQTVIFVYHRVVVIRLLYR